MTHCTSQNVRETLHHPDDKDTYNSVYIDQYAKTNLHSASKSAKTFITKELLLVKQNFIWINRLGQPKIYIIETEKLKQKVYAHLSNTLLDSSTSLKLQRSTLQFSKAHLKICEKSTMELVSGHSATLT